MTHPPASPVRVTLRFLEKLLLGAVLGSYLIVSRTIAVVGALYLVLYFFVGTSTFMDVVREAISDKIPGVISAATVRWGPAPSELRVADGRIFGENGEQVVQVDAVIADIDLLPTLAGLFRLMTEPDAPFAVHFDRVRLGHPKAFIHVDEAGRVDIERAFTRDEDPPEEGPPLTFAITAKAVDVMAGSGTVDAPSYHLDVAGLDAAATNFALTGEDHVAFFVPWGRVARADNAFSARVRLDDRLDPVRVPVTDLRVQGFLWDGLTFAWQGAQGDLPSGRISGTGGWDVGPDSPQWHGTTRLHLERDAPAVSAIAGDAFSGAFDATLSGAGNIEQANARIVIRAPEGDLGGVPFTDLRAGVRTLPSGVPSDPRAHALAVDWLAVDSLGGHVAVHDGFFGPESLDDRTDRTVSFAGAIRLDGVLLDAVGAAASRLLPADVDAAGPRRSMPLTEFAATRLSAVDATVHGNVVVAGRLGSHGETDASALLDDVAVAWRGDGLPLPGDYVVGGTARWRSAPVGGHAEGLELLPERRLELERVAIDGRGDRVRLEGSVDLATGQLDLVPYLRLGDIRDDARHLGLGDLDGRFVLKSAHVGGTLAAPHVRAVASWSNARAHGHALGNVTAQLALVGDRLEITRAHAASDLGAVTLDGHVTLFDGGLGRLNHALPFRVDRLDATGLELGLLLPEIGIRAPVDVKRARASGELAHLAATLVGQGTITASSVELGGESVRELSAHVDANAQRVALEDLVIVGRKGERVTGALSVSRRGERLHGTVRAKDLPLAAIRAVRRAAPELSGTLGANLTIGGTLAHPSLIGRLALGGINWDGVDLGDADLDLQTLPSGRIDISSASFFPGFELVDGSGADLDGFVPRHLRVTVRGAEARLSDLLPTTRRSGFQLTTRASATLDLWPRRAGKVWDLRVDAAPGEIELGVRDQNIRWTNATPLALVVEQEGARLSPVAFAATARRGRSPQAAPTLDSTGALVAPHDALSICGTVAQRGALDLELSGVADLSILRALKDAFSVFEGRVAIGDAPGVAASLGDDRCLPGDSAAVLRVTGSLAAPVLAGRLEPVGVTLVPRDFGREVRLLDGHGVDLVAGATPGSQRIISNGEGGLVAEVDEGNLSFAGELALNALALERADVAIVGTDVFYSSPGEFTATFNPSLRFVASGLDGESPRLALSGQVLITDGHFTRSFDTFAQALGSAIGGGRTDYSRPVGEAAPWLAGMTLDVDLKSSDFQIDSAFPLGQANMEARLDLTLGGTVGAPRVFRRVDLLPGGNLTYRVFRRDFEIRSGYVDFDGDAAHPNLDVTAQTEVTYLARASSDTQDEDEKEVLIALRIHGRVPDLKIEMSSDDSTFDQDDLQSLILTGRPRRELDRSTGSSVVTADLAAIFNDVLKAPFVRTAAVGLSREGDLRADVGTCFGPDLCFSTTAVQETTETTLRARFRLHLGDDLTCDGTLRRSDTAATTSTEETYEARCRYRIPLD